MKRNYFVTFNASCFIAQKRDYLSYKDQDNEL